MRCHFLHTQVCFHRDQETSNVWAFDSAPSSYMAFSLISSDFSTMSFIVYPGVLLLATLTAPFVKALPASTPTILAGGPATAPIPSNCTVTNLAPIFAQMHNQSYVPTSAANVDTLYSAYYPSFSPNATTMSQQCLQQCYGYGGRGQCKTAFWAEKMPVPEGHRGSPGGQLMTACILFSRTLTDEDFGTAPEPEGQASNTFAWSIRC